MSDLKPLPYYKFYWQEFRASRTVQRMDYITQGLYRSLLDECWAEGSIPTEMSEIADICGCPEQVLTDAWHMLSRCFALRQGRFINIKLDSVRTDQDKVRAIKALAGKAGGSAKSKNISEDEAYASTSLASVNGCHIEEKRREEKSKEEKTKEIEKVASIPTGKKRGTPTVKSWMVSYSPEVLAAVNSVLAFWPKSSERQPNASKGETVPTSSGPNLASRLNGIAAEGGDLEVCVAIAKRCTDEFRRGEHWSKAAENFFGKSDEAPWKSYYQAHITNREKQNDPNNA